jgi:hypothetical protein
MLITFQINREASLGLAHRMDADERGSSITYGYPPLIEWVIRPI